MFYTPTVKLCNYGGFGCSILQNWNSKMFIHLPVSFHFGILPGCAGMRSAAVPNWHLQEQRKHVQIRLQGNIRETKEHNALLKRKTSEPRSHPPPSSKCHTFFFPPLQTFPRSGWFCSAFLVVSGVLSPSVFIWRDGVHRLLILCQASIYRSEWRTQISTASWMSDFNPRYPHGPCSVCEVDMGTEK